MAIPEVAAVDVEVWKWLCASLFGIILALLSYMMGARGKMSREDSLKCRSEVDGKIGELVKSQTKMTEKIGELAGSLGTFVDIFAAKANGS